MASKAKRIAGEAEGMVAGVAWACSVVLGWLTVMWNLRQQSLVAVVMELKLRTRVVVAS